jgi:multiple sugar transport system substrate-binding protein
MSRKSQSKKSITRREFIHLGGVVAGALGLTACTSPTEVVKQVEVTRIVAGTPETRIITTTPLPTNPPATQVPEKISISVWDSNPDPAREQSWKERFTTFQKTNPGFEGTYVPTAAATFLQKLNTAVGGGRAPDIADMQGGWLPQFASMGALFDLEPYFQQWANQDDYLPALQKLSKAYGEKMFWIPGDLFALGMLYRADWIEELNLTDPNELYKQGNWTWEAFLETAKAMTDPAKNRYGFSLRGALGGERNLFNIIMSYTGGQWFLEDGTCLLDSPEAVAAVNWYADLLRKWKVTPGSAPSDGWREMTGNFSSGVVGMYMHSQDGLPAQRSGIEGGFEKVGVVPLPAGPTGSWAQLDGLGSAVFAQTKYPEVSAQLLFSSLSPDSYDITIKKDIDAGKPPFTSTTSMNFKSLFERPEFKADPHYWAFFDVLNKNEKVYLNPIHLAQYTFLVNSVVIPGFQKVILGQQTADAACKEWAAAFTKEQKAYLARLASS